MKFEQNNDLVVVKAAQDEQGTDYLFLTVDDMFSVGKAIDGWYSANGLHDEKYLDISQLLDSAPIRSIFGEKWDGSGLLIPTTEEIKAMPEIRMWELLKQHFEKMFKERCSCSCFMKYDRSDYGFVRAAEAGMTPIVFVTNEATDLIPGKSGWSSFRAMLTDPVAHGGKLIARGSRSLIYEVEWEGQKLALKTLNLENEARLDELYKRIKMAKRCSSDYRPNYLDRIGFMKMLIALINEIPHLPFDFVSCKEYAFGHNFQLTELVPGMSLDKLYRENPEGIGLREKLNRSCEAEAFLEENRILESDLWALCREFGEVIDPILTMLRQIDIWRSSDFWHYFTKNDIIIRGKSPEGRLQITLVDQGYRRFMGDGDGISDMMCDMEVWEKGKKAYDNLHEKPRFAEYVNRYFPNGWPERESSVKQESEKDVAALKV